MRRMYSENQLIKIIADKADELLKGAIYIDENTNVNIASVLFSPRYIVEGTGFANFVDEDGNTLQDALDAKSGKLYVHHIALTVNSNIDVFMDITTNIPTPLTMTNSEVPSEWINTLAYGWICAINNFPWECGLFTAESGLTYISRGNNSSWSNEDGDTFEVAQDIVISL